ncbi:hypothetical protein [Aureibacillus halotolerans]|uniref:YqbF C-terminal domain-containing protein n=1 Tax=Aureibacillus halotolerans TaxID=1508390 RepID=A0A4R6TVJ1_9BACI|nr:hypothetical protein [Aureibacillus halotolerans]TDQ35276.1 hypothetical protein EV213_12263 [Aureibacillus halotolerans]
MPFELKQTKGALHIGEGRFFYPGEKYEADDVPVSIQSSYFKKVDGPDNKAQTPPVQTDKEPKAYDEGSLKKLNKDAQEKAIEELGGKVEDAKNEGERIALILELQEAKKNDTGE